MATSLDRLVRKEVALGAIREQQPPMQHIGLSIAPFLDVATDDVIFDYIKGGLQDGLAPARAEDAEAELAQKDELLYGQGRAAVIDWSLKDKYTASDVTRYRGLFIRQSCKGAVDGGDITLNFVGRTVDDFQARVARHDALRKRKLDNRIEWLIMTAMETGGISYNDGRIKFTVSYGRPAGQHNQTPPGGLWNLTTCDPIGDLLTASQMLFDTYGVRPTQGLLSQKIVNNLWKSDRFLAAVGSRLSEVRLRSRSTRTTWVWLGTTRLVRWRSWSRQLASTSRSTTRCTVLVRSVPTSGRTTGSCRTTR